MTNPSSRPKFGTPPASSKRNWVLPAVIIAVLGIGAVLFLNRASDKHLEAKLEPAQYNTNTAQQGTIEISNGVDVNMGPQTDIRIRVAHVDLVGEAIFDIDEPIPVPLIVRVENAGVTAETGKYNLRGYPGDSVVRIAVESGQVNVRKIDAPESEPLVVSAGQVAQMDKAGVASLIPNASIAPAFSWADGTLKFEQTSVRDLARDLSRWYGLNVVVRGDALAAKIVSFQMGRKEMPEVVVRELNKLNGVSAVQNDKTVTLTPKK